MDVTQKKITTLNMQTLTPEEKQNFIIAMTFSPVSCIAFSGSRLRYAKRYGMVPKE
jgi:hypothetical protein